MAATVQMISYHGAAAATETQVDGGDLTFKRADNDTNDVANPIPIPGTGNAYSWRKSTKIKVTATPAGAISNLRWFTAGSAWGTGVTLYAAQAAAYTQGASGDEGAKIAGGVDASTYSSGSPKTVNAGTVLSNPSTGTGTQDYMVTQLEVSSAATLGSAGTATITYRWDEV